MQPDDMTFGTDRDRRYRSPVGIGSLTGVSRLTFPLRGTQPDGRPRCKYASAHCSTAMREALPALIDSPPDLGTSASTGSTHQALSFGESDPRPRRRRRSRVPDPHRTFGNCYDDREEDLHLLRSTSAAWTSSLRMHLAPAAPHGFSAETVDEAVEAQLSPLRPPRSLSATCTAWLSCYTRAS